MLYGFALYHTRIAYDCLRLRMDAKTENGSLPLEPSKEAVQLSGRAADS